MSPIAHLRRLRRLPHALLAVLAIAVAQTSLVPCAMAYSVLDAQVETMGVAMPAMDEHCAYCPADALTPGDVTIGDCVYTHAPAIDVFPGSAQHVDALLSSPLLHASTFDLSWLRDARSFVPVAYFAPPQARPLTLTYCVQLK
jgi:hypothetical protein